VRDQARGGNTSSLARMPKSGTPRSPFSGAAHAHRVQQILASLGIAHAHARPWFPLASRISCLERKLQVEEGRRKHGGARHALILLKYKKTPRSRANWLRLPPAFLFLRHRHRRQHLRVTASIFASPAKYARIPSPRTHPNRLRQRTHVSTILASLGSAHLPKKQTFPPI